ncbi:MAG: hypothetical protein SVW02_02695 [Candidatus Nanohaloarchaea archaeon]|nr:hypothetical protein [Candidatus Nanohaloarchaea archaeon]
MAKDRVPLEPDEEDDEPVTVSAEELRAGIDRDYAHEEESSRSRRTAPSRTEHPQETAQQDEGSGQERRSLEERAVQRTVQKLREKGKSDQFIEDHMDEIRERVQAELER